MSAARPELSAKKGGGTGRHSTTALDFLETALLPRLVEITHVPPELERPEWAWLRQHDKRDHSFVDVTSFATMQNLHI